jgi:hypothetical protein
VQATSYLNGVATARSARFDDAVVNGGIAVTQAFVQRGGVILVDDVGLLPGARITMDATAQVRRTMTAEVADEDGTLTPLLASDSLAPYGSELVVRVGYRYTDGDVEVVPVGVFRLERTGGDTTGVVSLTGYDRSKVVSEARFEVPYVIATGTNLATAVEELIDSRYPGLTYVMSPTTKTVPLTVYEEGDHSGGDPFRNAAELALSDGMELFVDAEGRVVMRPVPDPTTAEVVWEFTPGPEQLLISATNELDAELARNVAVVKGEGSGVPTPVRGTAEISDPASPIYASGPFGRRPVFLVTPLIGNNPATAQAEADAAAEALLQRRAGGSEALAFTAVPNPAHEPGDVTRVAPTALPVDVNVVLESWTLDPLLLTATDYRTSARRSSL